MINIKLDLQLILFIYKFMTENLSAMKEKDPIYPLKKLYTTL